MGISLAVATAFAWGIREVLLRKAFEATKPIQGLFITMLFTFIFSFIAAFIFESAFWSRLTLADALLWLIIGVLYFGVGVALYYQGIESVGGSRTSVVSNSSAIVTPLLGMALLSEPSRPHIALGVFATGAGIFMVSASNLMSDDWRLEKGIVCALLAGLVWSVTTILIRFGLIGLGLPMTSLGIASGTTLLPLTVFLSLKNKKTMLSGLRHSWTLIGGSLLGAIGQVTQLTALFFAPTVYVVPIYSLKCLVTVFLANLVIPKSEKVNTKVILGALLSIVGIVLITI